VHANMHNVSDRAGKFSGNDLGPYSPGIGFESQLTSLIFSLRLFLVFFSDFKKMCGKVLRSDHDRFLPNFFHFVIYASDAV
jgi:hypothetical protein